VGAKVGISTKLSYAFAMSIDSILAEIDTEIARLTQVRSLLAGSGKVTSAFSERKTKKIATKGRKKRVLSPEARKRIADAQRKRWAAQKAKAK
jgi:siroheme synthase (precorrin-2 oxidase/ferrochelatase)